MCAGVSIFRAIQAAASIGGVLPGGARSAVLGTGGSGAAAETGRAFEAMANVISKSVAPLSETEGVVRSRSRGGRGVAKSGRETSGGST